jgi:small-conductance mechanosensitive channel/CRP-like cAMP-binding protein
MGYALIAALALALALLALRPKDRTATRNSLVLLGLAAVAELVGHAVETGAAARAGTMIADAASILMGLVLIRLVAMFVFRVLLPVLRFMTPRIIEDLAVTALFAAWGLLWFRMAGVELGSLLATSAVITAVLAFSMKDTLGNVLGGVVLQLDESIQVGDWVKLEDVSGRVVEIRWRHTAIETRNRETVVVPNSWLMTNRFMVIGSRADPKPVWRRWVRVNVDLSASPTSVCAALERSVRDADIANVASDPPANAVLLEIGPRYGTYALRYFLTNPQADDPTDSAVRAHVLASLERKGMKLGVPYQEELTIKDNEAHRAELAARELERHRRALNDCALFASLSGAELDALAGQLVDAPFVKGDTITRQGDVAHWLYLIASGNAEVVVETPAGRQPIATLMGGSVFGEMGMMTGEPRKATVVARSDVQCYRLDKAGFEGVLKARPDVANEISRVLASREMELEDVVEASAGGKPKASREAILGRIRDFFGLDTA